MANNKQTTVEEQKAAVKQLVVDAKFVMRSYDTKDDNGNNVKREFVSFELVDAFNDEDFRDIALKAKWDKYDDKNRLVRPDRVFGWMSYYAKKVLKTASEVPVKVTIKPITYKSKRTSEMVTYPAMFAAPTFSELADERPVEVVVKGANNANIFLLLAGNALGISFSARNTDDDDDVGLGDGAY